MQNGKINKKKIEKTMKNKRKIRKKWKPKRKKEKNENQRENKKKNENLIENKKKIQTKIRLIFWFIISLLDSFLDFFDCLLIRSFVFYIICFIGQFVIEYHSSLDQELKC